MQDNVTVGTIANSRRLRALPWSWDSDTESDADPSEVVVSSNVPPEADPTDQKGGGPSTEKESPKRKRPTLANPVLAILI